MPQVTAPLLYSLLFLLIFVRPAAAQDSAFKPKHAAILFPYPMYQEKWRSSLGFTLLTTPEDITEEVRLRIPCGDFRVLRRINNYLISDNRVMFQFLQNHLSTGLHVSVPVNSNFYLRAGNDIGYWFGFLKVSGFNSTASGWLNYTSISAGYKTRRNLLISFKAQISYNLFYKTANGENKFNSSKGYYNGETFTLALEQPFYGKKHLTLAFSTINNYFYWQTWALFYKTNRKVFYPQITVSFIL